MALQGKVAFITGSSRGIGRAIAQRLAHDGALVVVHYGHGKEAAQQTVQEIEANEYDCTGRHRNRDECADRMGRQVDK